MGLSIGIVGLPNVGKSTVFNALTGAQNAVVANYPFCTIQPNKAIVAVPDERVEHLAEMVSVSKMIHATIEFLDIAGLVKGASSGEGLGNQFLGQIRNTDAILHVVRCFQDPNVVHVSPEIDPISDIEVVNLELILADMQQLERKIERLNSQVKGDKKILPLLELTNELLIHLQSGNPVSNFSAKEMQSDLMDELNHELQFLTAKPVIYVANVDECEDMQTHPLAKKVELFADESGAQFVTICAKLESEIQDLNPQERQELLQMAGLQQSGLGQVIQKSFEQLGLISFFTKNETEVRAWEIPKGTTAPKAAGIIHTDFEQGFIRAEVIPYDVFVQYGGETAVKAAGRMRLEGKEYVVQDGDIIFFRFNV
jgi:GTP-binding protein YchF